MNVFRFKKFQPSPEQEKIKIEAEALSREAKRELAEAREMAIILRNMRERNHFASSFRKALGGTDGS
jgi:hypothetical protein